jgi:hypothetical protein
VKYAFANTTAQRGTKFTLRENTPAAVKINELLNMKIHEKYTGY